MIPIPVSVAVVGAAKAAEGSVGVKRAREEEAAGVTGDKEIPAKADASDH